jgi:hypothetical protein
VLDFTIFGALVPDLIKSGFVTGTVNLSIRVWQLTGLTHPIQG